MVQKEKFRHWLCPIGKKFYLYSQHDITTLKTGFASTRLCSVCCQDNLGVSVKSKSLLLHNTDTLINQVHTDLPVCTPAQSVSNYSTVPCRKSLRGYFIMVLRP